MISPRTRFHTRLSKGPLIKVINGKLKRSHRTGISWFKLYKIITQLARSFCYSSYLDYCLSEKNTETAFLTCLSTFSTVQTLGFLCSLPTHLQSIVNFLCFFSWEMFYAHPSNRFTVYHSCILFSPYFSDGFLVCIL